MSTDRRVELVCEADWQDVAEVGDTAGLKWGEGRVSEGILFCLVMYLGGLINLKVRNHAVCVLEFS